MGNSNVVANKSYEVTNPKDKQDEEMRSLKYVIGAHMDLNYVVLPWQFFIIMFKF